ncbi:DNA polymerase V [Winslowiella arboricola]|uniref:DNA polymerase V n=1 Tax=Winslowiella arboricola TaxID=2978220 RepID=UPI00225E2ED7|nr:DNA polymerase V [Winslowiella arboricola]MCU5775243.1 DNA polymerase V [Winslowiella arboricola]
MPKLSDKEIAFRDAVKRLPETGWTVTTDDFVASLARYNWPYTHREANVWIEHHKSQFKDISTQEGEFRTFRLYNYNVGV